MNLIIIAGRTGAGKTTTLEAVTGRVPCLLFGADRGMRLTVEYAADQPSADVLQRAPIGCTTVVMDSLVNLDLLDAEVIEALRRFDRVILARQAGLRGPIRSTIPQGLQEVADVVAIVECLSVSRARRAAA